jgi:hypothetical protein
MKTQNLCVYSLKKKKKKKVMDDEQIQEGQSEA